MSHYIITCYLPSGMFVIVSWISFLIPPDIVPGRMTLLITVFLVLVNIFNTITTNIPKAEGLTAIEAWVMVCVLFVFGALVGKTKTKLYSHVMLYTYMIWYDFTLFIYIFTLLLNYSEYAGILLQLKVRVSTRKPPLKRPSSHPQDYHPACENQVSQLLLFFRYTRIQNCISFIN